MDTPFSFNGHDFFDFIFDNKRINTSKINIQF
jgi:hypothetical protein